VPVLLFLYPNETPAAITSISLTVACFNAISGSIAYGRLKRIDYKSGLFFSLTAIPGAIIGAYIISFLNRSIFQYVFGVIVLIVAAYLLARPGKKITLGFLQKRQTHRQLYDSQRNIYNYSFNLPSGMFIAFFVGVISGLLGIGGGIVHVPALTQVLCFPAHVATATSHFMVAITTFAAIDTHVVSGTFSGDIGVTLVLSAGVVVGAQFGARLSEKVTGVLIVRLLALGLIIVALRLLIAPI
jgi:uncharacterized membrane protein YfcA